MSNVNVTDRSRGLLRMTAPLAARHTLARPPVRITRFALIWFVTALAAVLAFLDWLLAKMPITAEYFLPQGLILSEEGDSPWWVSPLEVMSPCGTSKEWAKSRLNISPISLKNCPSNAALTYKLCSPNSCTSTHHSRQDRGAWHSQWETSPISFLRLIRKKSCSCFFPKGLFCLKRGTVIDDWCGHLG